MRQLLMSSLALCLTAPAFAHGGGLNAQGCHNNKKTGDYHCYRSPRTVPKPNSNAQTPPLDSLQSNERTTINRPYRNCTEARALGAAPVRRGEPGYGRHLDRDNDGVGCE